MTTRRIVVDHVLFVVSDLAESRRLYTAALAPVRYEELHVQEDGVHYGVDGLDDFAIYQGAPVTTAAHVAFDAADRASVDSFFGAALANGATARGEPGVWPSTRSGTMRRSSTTSTATTSRLYGTLPSR